jgi:hypothetical protein
MFLNVKNYYYLDKLTNSMSQLQVNQVKDKGKNKTKKKQNYQTTKQSLRINRTIPTHTKQLASYCWSLMRGLK